MNYRNYIFLAASAIILAIFIYLYIVNLKRYLASRNKIDLMGMRRCRRKIRRAHMGILLAISILILMPIISFEDFFKLRPMLLACIIGVVLILILWIFIIVAVDIKDLRNFVKDEEVLDILKKNRKDSK